MSNTTPPPHASSSYAYNYGGRWQGISVEKVINAFLQFLEMDPEKNEVNYDTYGRFHACYESVADAVYGATRDANARRNDTKWLDTLWKQNRRKIRTIVLRKALEQSRITREQLEKCRRKALERAAANYDFIETSSELPVDSKNRQRGTRQRDTANSTKQSTPAAAAKQNGALHNGAAKNESDTQSRPAGSTPSFCVPVPTDRCVKLAIFTSNSLKLGQLLAPFEMPNGTLLVLDNDEVFVFQKAHVNLNVQLAVANGQSSQAQSQNVVAPAAAAAEHFESPPPRTRNKRKSKAPRCVTRSKRLNGSEPTDDDEHPEPDTRSSSNYSLVNGSPFHLNGSPIVSHEDDRATVRGPSRANTNDVWFGEADVKPLIIAE